MDKEPEVVEAEVIESKGASDFQKGLAVFFVIMCIFPEIKSNEEFEYWKIALGGIGGGGVAFLNFLLMGLTVQKVAADTNQERARSRMKLSYTYRYLMQVAWIVIAILVPCFNYISGIIPLHSG